MIKLYPYTNFHELNLDWILKTMKEIVGEVNALETDISSLDIEKKITSEVEKKIKSGELSATIGGQTLGSSYDDIYEFLSGEHNLVISCAGDSLTYGQSPEDSTQVENTYPIVLSRLCAIYGNVTVNNLGMSGRTSTDFNSHLSEIPSATDVCIYMFGTNDINHDILPSVTIENILNFVEYCNDNEITPIICTPPCLLRPDNIRRERHNTLSLLIKMCCEILCVKCVDMYEMTLNAINDGSITYKVMVDGTHWTDYSFIAGAIFKTIFGGCCTVLKYGFNNLTRNNGVITSAGLVGTLDDIITYKNLRIYASDTYKCVLFVEKKSDVYIVGDGISSGGTIVFKLNDKQYSLSVNKGLSASKSAKTFIDTLNAGVYIMEVVSVLGDSDSPTFYLNGMYCEDIVILGDNENYVVRNYVSDSTEYSSSSTNAISITIDEIEGYTPVMVSVYSISSAGIVTSYCNFANSTTVSWRGYSARSSTANITVQIRVLYMKN